MAWDSITPSHQINDSPWQSVWSVHGCKM